MIEDTHKAEFVTCRTMKVTIFRDMKAAFVTSRTKKITILRDNHNEER